MSLIHPKLNNLIWSTLLGAMLLFLLPALSFADEIIWKDGRVKKDVFLRMHEGTLEVVSNDDNLPLPVVWDDLDRVAYSFPVKTGDFAQGLEKFATRLEEIHPSVASWPIPESANPELLQLAWNTAWKNSNTLPEKDKQAFLDDTPISRILFQAESCRGFFHIRDESNEDSDIIIQKSIIQVLFGLRLIESSLPERFEQGLSWIEEGLERLGKAFEYQDQDDRDWNLIFMLNRLYKVWPRTAPTYPEQSVDWYVEQLNREEGATQFTPSTQFPDRITEITERYIQASHGWIAASSDKERIEVLQERQQFLAGQWVRSLQPGLKKSEFFYQHRIQNRWNRMRVLSDIAYLTAESSLFKRTQARLEPQTQTNMPPLRDSFSGQSYRYIRQEAQDFIYSIGPDLIDQKASQAFSISGEGTQGDIFLLPKP